MPVFQKWLSSHLSLCHLIVSHRLIKLRPSDNSYSIYLPHACVILTIIKPNEKRDAKIFTTNEKLALDSNYHKNMT